MFDHKETLKFLRQGAVAVLRDLEALQAGQPDQQPGIHGPQNYQQQSSPAKNLIP